MAKKLEIIPGAATEKVLNKEQKRFNRLVQQISNLRVDIQLAKELDMELRRIGTERIKPADDKVFEGFRTWVFTLHNHPTKTKLSKKLAEKFPDVMLKEISPLLYKADEDDVELRELYAFYEGSGRNYELILEEKELEEKKIAASMMEAFFGIEIDPDELDDPQKWKEKIDAKQAAFEEAQAQTQAQTQRKKNTMANAAAEKRRAAEESVNKTTKQIYLDLVRNFHPDKEPDEQKRAEKTEIMQQITAAFEADDHLRLLELQLNLLSSRDNVFATFNNAQLKYFNQTLQKQVQELEQEFYFTSPEGNGNPYGHLFSLNRTDMLRNIERQIQDHKNILKGIQHNLKMVQEPLMFKDYIRDFELDYGW